MATLTRQDMERVIREGGSVLHDGRLYSRLETLPSAADLAKGNPEQEAAAASALHAQIDALRGQLAKLQQPASVQADEAGGTPVGSPPSGDASPSSLNADQAKALADAGFASRDAINGATDDELLAVPGIGQATLAKLRQELEG